MKIKYKISTKIMLSIILVNLIILGTISGTVVYLLNENVGNEAKEFATTIVRSNVNEFEQAFSNIESAVSVIASEIIADVNVSMAMGDKQYLQDYKKELAKRLKKVGEGTGLTKSVYVYFNVEKFGQEVDIWMLDNGSNVFELQDSFGVDYYKDYNSWYSDPIDSQLTLWTFPYVSEAGGIITSYVKPIIVNGESIGLAGMDLYLDDIALKLGSVELFESGYLYLMHPDGRTMVHKDLAFEENILDTGDYQLLLDEMNSKETGFTHYEDGSGTDILSAYSHLDNGWIVASAVPEKEVLSIVRSIINVLLIVLVFGVVISVIVSQVIGKRITKPINQIVEATEKIKNGDFTTLVEVKTNDETKLLAISLNGMSEAVRSLIKEAQHVASDMVDAASNLASMSEETNATVDQVALTIQEIAKGTQDTAENAELGAEVAGEINEKFVTLMDNSTSMKKNAEYAMEVNKSGLVAIDDLREKSDANNASNNKVKEAVYNLDKKANAITDIIATITSISEQTNLLALNASIEAARAGEAGRGFAVVAEEIRKLAESSSQSADEIRTIISAIQNESKETVSVMNEVAKINEQQNESLTNVNDSFDKIFGSVESISAQIEVVTKELDELFISKNKLIEGVNNISAVSEETAAATEEVEHSMDEQTKAVEEVAKNAERLNSLSAELNDKIKIFTV
ncbi:MULTISPECIES: methyl-accepting chemotaxis protein [unclassified Fusibacter]|uniref:methyl-accepting chemotaxis protein n=1 Tax=unclassified Fusibacter TaxID=2624464 RepID=UPI0010117E48|nr:MULTISPECIES: methyl-accepting chemotaxis protein [unclassified Fusibacter]MCK8060172.1 methyl-accepting chemotaxis protein [Fusibacter sp. A2]NPE22312.1 methyl-accepting chemotaxis protein [Fusibacter sp. A1]RXV61085.1 methyl-accepting chemotaxis protein [Fusibacter sp. A1]